MLPEPFQLFPAFPYFRSPIVESPSAWRATNRRRGVERGAGGAPLRGVDQHVGFAQLAFSVPVVFPESDERHNVARSGAYDHWRSVAFRDRHGMIVA